jgi:hypothetical protein
MSNAAIFSILILILMLSCPGINANPISLDFGNIKVLVDLEKPHGTIPEWNMTNNTTPRLNTTIPNFQFGNGFVFGYGTIKKTIWRVDPPKMPPNLPAPIPFLPAPNPVLLPPLRPPPTFQQFPPQDGFNP